MYVHVHKPEQHTIWTVRIFSKLDGSAFRCLDTYWDIDEGEAEAGLCRPPVPPVRTDYMDGKTSRFYEEDLVY